MTTALALFTASTALIFGKAFQQLNVTQHRGALAIMPVSFWMAFCEVVIVVNVARTGELWTALPIGLGGGAGCLIGMVLHRRLFRYPARSQRESTVGAESEDECNPA